MGTGMTLRATGEYGCLLSTLTGCPIAMAAGCGSPTTAGPGSPMSPGAGRLITMDAGSTMAPRGYGGPDRSIIGQYGRLLMFRSSALALASASATLAGCRLGHATPSFRGMD